MFIESRRTTTAWYDPNKYFTINKRRRLTGCFFILLFNTFFLPFLVYAHFIHLLSSKCCLIPRQKNQYVFTIFFSLLFWLSFSSVFSSFGHESFLCAVNWCDFFAFLTLTVIWIHFSWFIYFSCAFVTRFTWHFLFSNFVEKITVKFLWNSSYVLSFHRWLSIKLIEFVDKFVEFTIELRCAQQMNPFSHLIKSTPVEWIFFLAAVQYCYYKEIRMRGWKKCC